MYEVPNYTKQNVHINSHDRQCHGMAWHLSWFGLPFQVFYLCDKHWNWLNYLRTWTVMLTILKTMQVKYYPFTFINNAFAVLRFIAMLQGD